VTGADPAFRFGAEPDFCDWGGACFPLWGGVFFCDGGGACFL